MKEFTDTGWLLLAGSFLSQEFFRVDHRGVTLSDLDLIWFSSKDYPSEKIIKRMVKKVTTSYGVKEFNHVSVRQVNNDILENVPGWIANTWMAVIDYHKLVSLVFWGKSNFSPKFKIPNNEDILSAIDIAWIYSVFTILKYNTISGFGYAFSKLFLVISRIIAQCERLFSYKYIDVAKMIGTKFPSLNETCELAMNIKIGNYSHFSKLEVKKLLQDSQVLSKFLMNSICHNHDSIMHLMCNIDELIFSKNHNEKAALKIASEFRNRSKNLPYFEKDREKRYKEAANQLENRYLL